jgi:hypothetical protein
MKKVLIVGDSFAANWPGNGWPKMLAASFDVTNLAQAGVGEYKILKQLQSVDCNTFDTVVVSHTSPSRIHTPSHPLHKTGIHKDCDLIYEDLQRPSWFNKSLSAAKGWFNYHYDDQYQIDMYLLVRKEIKEIIKIPYVSISHADFGIGLSIEDNHIDFKDLWKEHRGSVNHYDHTGNSAVYKKLMEVI